MRHPISIALAAVVLTAYCPLNASDTEVPKSDIVPLEIRSVIDSFVDSTAWDETGRVPVVPKTVDDWMRANRVRLVLYRSGGLTLEKSNTVVVYEDNKLISERVSLNGSILYGDGSYSAGNLRLEDWVSVNRNRRVIVDAPRVIIAARDESGVRIVHMTDYVRFPLWGALATSIQGRSERGQVETDATPTPPQPPPK